MRLWDEKIVAQLRELVAGGKKPPFSFRRDDGSMLMIADSTMVEFLLSERPEPDEADLDRVFRGATSASFWRGGFVPPSGRGKVLRELTKPEALAELRENLRIGESGFHCGCLGDYDLEVSGPEGLRAKISLHHGRSIRWDGTWKSDARLVKGRQLLEWLAQFGFEQPLRELEADEERGRQAQRDREAWQEAMPACLEPFWPEVEQDAMTPWETSSLHEPMLAALRATCRTEDDVVLALLAWYGYGARRWNGIPSYEFLPGALLQTFATDAIVRALGREDVGAKHLEGAARLFCSWPFGTQRKGDWIRVPSELRERMRKRLEACANEEPLRTFQSVFGDA